MFKLDFLAHNTIIRYLIILTLTLVMGTIIKEGIAIIFSLVIIYYSIQKNLYRAVELFFIWFFVSNFFIGQGYITNEIILKYIAKPTFLLLIIFLFFINRIPSKLLNVRYISIWMIFLVLTLISSITHGQSPFVIISISAFFIVYLILQANGFTPYQYQNILNLFVAVAILQTFVSFLQVFELIPPSTEMMDDGSGGHFLFVAGLDDVASGTFGSGESHVTSWYASLISIFLIIIWSITKKSKYFIIIAIIFLQFATVDSKTIMGVTILMFSYYVIYLYKNRTKYQLNFGKYFLFFFLILIGSYGFFKVLNSYYEYYGKKTEGSRNSLSGVYKSEVNKSTDLVLSHIGEWGKIRGFQYIFEDFVENNPQQLIWGYGSQGYGYNDKMEYIESKDSPVMKLNNFTNSRSGLLTQFATSGFIGFLLFIIAIILWYKYNIRMINNKFGLIENTLLKIFLFFSLIAAFLYSISITTIPLITFAALIAILKQMAIYKEISIYKQLL